MSGLMSPMNLALAGAAIASVVVLMKVKKDKAAGGSAPKSKIKAGKSPKVAKQGRGLSLKGKGSFGRSPKGAKPARSAGGRKLNLSLRRGGRKELPIAAVQTQMAMAETGAAATLEAPAMGAPSWSTAPAPPTWNPSEIITAPGWPTPGGDTAWAAPSMPMQGDAVPEMAMANAVAEAPGQATAAPEVGSYNFNETSLTDTSAPASHGGAPPVEVNEWDDDGFDPTSGWAVPDAPPESMTAQPETVTQWSMDETTDLSPAPLDDPIAEWSLPAAPEAETTEWSAHAAEETPEWSLPAENELPAFDMSPELPAFDDTPATAEIVSELPPVTEWALPDAPVLAAEEPLADWSMDPVQDIAPARTPEPISWSDTSFSDEPDALSDDGADSSWGIATTPPAIETPALDHTPADDFDFEAPWESDTDLGAEPLVMDEPLTPARSRVTPNPFESWMSLRPGGRLSDELELLEEDSNVLTIVEDEWDEEDDASELRTSGRFALGGNALEGGHIAIGGVSFREQITASGWRELSNIERSLRIRLHVEGTHNCAAQDLVILVDPGFGPDREGFTLRLEAEQAGPFMASGTFHILPT